MGNLCLQVFVCSFVLCTYVYPSIPPSVHPKGNLQTIKLYSQLNFSDCFVSLNKNDNSHSSGAFLLHLSTQVWHKCKKNIIFLLLILWNSRGSLSEVDDRLMHLLAETFGGLALPSLALGLYMFIREDSCFTCSWSNFRCWGLFLICPILLFSLHLPWSISFIYFIFWLHYSVHR